MGTLPADLHDQARTHVLDFALSAGTGDIRDAFSGSDHFPLPYLGPWIVRDLARGRRQPNSAGSTAERTLCVVGYLLALRAHAAAAIAQQASFADAEHIALVQWYSEQIVLALAREIPAGERYWARFGRLPAQAVTDEAQVTLTPLLAAPACAITLAAAHLAHVDGEETSLALCAMVGELACCFQIGQELASIQRDAAAGTMTYAIAVVCRIAGLPLRPLPAPDVLLGAMVVTGALHVLLAESASHLETARKSASELGLRTLSAFIGDVAASARQRDFDPGPNPAAASRVPKVRLSSEPAPLPMAIGMAVGYLDADRTFRESWETHREGMFGADLVVSRFPAALVLEIERGAGRDVGVEVAKVMSDIEGNGFRYYDHIDSDVDTDTVGVYLRLAGQKLDQRPRNATLHRVLQCLHQQVALTSAIPVWLIGCEEPRVKSVTLGEGCGTVSAHLLLGLAELADESAGATLQTGTTWLCARICAVGLGANINYPQLFALSVFFRLVHRVGVLPDVVPAKLLDETRSRLTSELERLTETSSRTAQEAALMVAACSAAGRMDLVETRHLSAILKQQHFDGGWAGEPFAAAPNRGQRISPYSSATLTTALCHAALVTLQQRDRAFEHTGRSVEADA
jgi:hypothetical protein